jgi:histidine triad (HIT) family protein
MKSVFERIIDRDLPSDIVFENDRIIAIKDIAPVAPVHLLLIPKKPIVDLQSLSSEDLSLISEIVAVAQDLAEKFNVQNGYRFLTNNGADAGQEISHLHFHLIGGRRLSSIG